MEPVSDDTKHYRACMLSDIGGPDAYRGAYQVKFWGEDGSTHVLTITPEEFDAIRAILTR